MYFAFHARGLWNALFLFRVPRHTGDVCAMCWAPHGAGSMRIDSAPLPPAELHSAKC